MLKVWILACGQWAAFEGFKEEMGLAPFSVPLVLYSDPQENCLELIKADAASRPDSGQEAWPGLGSWRWLQRSGQHI